MRRRMRNLVVWWSCFVLSLLYCFLAIWHREPGTLFHVYFFPYVYVVLPISLMSGTFALAVTARVVWIAASQYAVPKDSLMRLISVTSSGLAGWFGIFSLFVTLYILGVVGKADLNLGKVLAAGTALFIFLFGWRRITHWRILGFLPLAVFLMMVLESLFKL